MASSFVFLLWTMMAHFFSPRHNAEIRFLKAQIRILQARVTAKRISPSPEEKSELLRIGAECDHNVADLMEISLAPIGAGSASPTRASLSSSSDAPA